MRKKHIVGFIMVQIIYSSPWCRGIAAVWVNVSPGFLSITFCLWATYTSMVFLITAYGDWICLWK